MTKEELLGKSRYNMEDLCAIVEILRSPGGCPWDIEQTHKSIRKDFIEETYEVVEAIDNDDSDLLCEELGDVLLQVAFHTQIEREAGRFTLDDVTDGVSKKMILRHPHVFADGNAKTSDEVLENWDAIKRVEKQRETVTSSLRAIPPALPALMRGTKVAKKIAKAGADDASAEELLAEIAKTATALAAGDGADGLGELLMLICRAAAKRGEDPEELLSRACDRAIDEFAKSEQDA